MKYDNKLKLYYIYEDNYFFYGETKEKCQECYNECKKLWGI